MAVHGGTPHQLRFTQPAAFTAKYADWLAQIYCPLVCESGHAQPAGCFVYTTFCFVLGFVSLETMLGRYTLYNDNYAASFLTGATRDASLA